MKPLRSAVIGCGNISRRHTAALHGSESAELVAVCDISQARAAAVAEKYGVEYTLRWQDIIAREDIDCVHLCTPHHLHAPMAIAALRAGKHVFTEKPMATTPEDAQAMIDAARESGKYLGVCFQNRYKHINAELCTRVQSGEFGKALGARGIVNWHRTPAYYTESGWRGTFESEGGGVLINQSIHTLDLMLWTMGDAESVRAGCGIFSLADTIEVEDTAVAHFTFPGGAGGLFFASNAWVNDAPVLFEVQCERALLTAGENDLLIRYTDGREEHIADTTPKTEDKAYWGNCHGLIIEDFYSAIAEGRPFAVDGEQGIRTLRTVFAIYKASAFGPRA